MIFQLELPDSLFLNDGISMQSLPLIVFAGVCLVSFGTFLCLALSIVHASHGVTYQV